MRTWGWVQSQDCKVSSFVSALTQTSNLRWIETPKSLRKSRRTKLNSLWQFAFSTRSGWFWFPSQMKWQTKSSFQSHTEREGCKEPVKSLMIKLLARTIKVWSRFPRQSRWMKREVSFQVSQLRFALFLRSMWTGTRKSCTLTSWTSPLSLHTKSFVSWTECPTETCQSAGSRSRRVEAQTKGTPECSCYSCLRSRESFGRLKKNETKWTVGVPTKSGSSVAPKQWCPKWVLEESFERFSKCPNPWRQTLQAAHRQQG